LGYTTIDIAMEKSQLIAIAKKRGPNALHQGVSLLEWAQNLGDQTLVARLIRMGADPIKSRVKTIRLDPIAKGTTQLLGALTDWLSSVEDPCSAAHSPFTEVVLRWSLELGGSCLERAKELILKVTHSGRECPETGMGWGEQIASWAIEDFDSSALEKLLSWGVKVERIPTKFFFYLFGMSPKKQRRRVELLRRMLEGGADPEGVLAHVLSSFGDESCALEAAQIALEHGADPFETYLNRPLTSFCRHPKTLKWLMDLGVGVAAEDETVRLMCEIDPPGAVRLAAQAEERRESLVWVAFSRMVLEEKRERRALSSLKLFEGAPLPLSMGIQEFKGSLKRLLRVAEWLGARGHSLKPEWLVWAFELGGKEEELERIVEMIPPEVVGLAVKWLWERRNSDEELLRAMPRLAWLSRLTGFADARLLKRERVTRAYLEAAGNPNARICIPHYSLTGAQRIYATIPLLLRAVMDRMPESARALLEVGADPNLGRDGQGTPLHWAIPDWKLTKMLLEYGADPAIRNEHGETAVEVAKRRGDKRFVRRFLEHPLCAQVERLGMLREL